MILKRKTFNLRILSQSVPRIYGALTALKILANNSAFSADVDHVSDGLTSLVTISTLEKALFR